MPILTVSLADKDVLSLNEGEITSTAGESKYSCAELCLPDAINENKTKYPQRNSVKPANLISGTWRFQLIQLLLAGMKISVKTEVEENVSRQLSSRCWKIWSVEAKLRRVKETETYFAPRKVNQIVSCYIHWDQFTCFFFLHFQSVKCCGVAVNWF